MAYIDWSEEFSVNVREIDAHHKKLVEKINLLHQSLLDNKGPEAQKIIVAGMVDYAEFHFAAEEKLMLRHNYPGYRSTRPSMAASRKWLLICKSVSTNSGFVLTLEILSFLKSWLQEHILVTDKKYSQHFNLNGVY